MLAVRMPLWKRILVMLLSLLGCLDVFQNKTKGQGNRCDGGNGCCAGYTWNEQLKTCEKCDLGYYGIDCDKPCQYPYYGENCDGECSCPEGRCNISYGCLSSNDTYMYSTVYSESHYNGTTSASVELSSPPKDKYKHGYFYQIPQQRFNIIISLICVGVFILVVVVISVGYVLHKRALRRFYPASSCDANINSIGLVCKHENGDKVFAGDAKLGIFYNKERKTYHVEICTDQRIVSSDNQYLTADETRPVEEPVKVYESLEEDFKLSLGTIRPNVKNSVPDSSESYSGSESECDTTVKEVARSTNTDQSRKETDKNVYLTVY